VSITAQDLKSATVRDWRNCSRLMSLTARDWRAKLLEIGERNCLEDRGERRDLELDCSEEEGEECEEDKG